MGLWHQFHRCSHHRRGGGAASIATTATAGSATWSSSSMHPLSWPPPTPLSLQPYPPAPLPTNPINLLQLLSRTRHLQPNKSMDDCPPLHPPPPLLGHRCSSIIPTTSAPQATTSHHLPPPPPLQSLYNATSAFTKKREEAMVALPSGYIIKTQLNELFERENILHFINKST